MKKLKIMDWYVHQGNQVEFFKTGHNFSLTSTNASVPNWNDNHRPLNSNVTLIKEVDALKQKFDVVIVRSSLNPERYKPFMRKGAKGVAVVQTTDPFRIPNWVDHVVWNSHTVMEKYKSQFPKKKHYYIPHGFDPEEFRPLNIERNGKILSVYNVFKRRAGFLGYDLWEYIYQHTNKNCVIVGHGNEDMNMGIKECDTFEELIRTYNSYSVFLNTTKHSAMPRSRGEAAMCGSPIVTTNNYDISMYFSHKKNAILTNDRDELIKGINELLESSSMREDFGHKAREVAIKHFHIKDNIEKWNHIFSRL